MKDEKPYTSPLSTVMTSIGRFIATPGLGDAIKMQTLRGVGVGLLTKVLAAGIGFSCQVLLARMMGVTEYGQLVYVLTWTNVLSVLPKCGLDVALVRYVAQYRAREEWGKLRAIVILGAKVSLLGGVVVVAISALGIYLMRDHLGNNTLLGFLLGLAALPLLAANSLRVAALYGLKRVFLAEFPDGVLRPFLLTATIAVMWAFGDITAIRVLSVNLGMFAIVFVVGGYWLIKSLPAQVRQFVSEYRMQEWMKTSWPLMGIAAIQMVMTQMDVLMVGAILGTEQAGVYFAGARLSDLVVLGLAGVNSIAAPMISELHHTGRKPELQHMLTLVTRSSVVVTVLAAVFLVVLGDRVLWLFGGQFVAAYYAMVILVVGQIVNASCGSVGFLMTMTGNERGVAYVMGAGVVLNILLNLLLIPLLGMIGAAIATASGIIFWNIVLLVETRKRLGVDASILASGRLL